MKIIVDLETSVVKYAFPERASVIMTPDSVDVRDTWVESNIGFSYDDVNDSNSIKYKNVTLPEDYLDNKYTYDGSEWTIVGGWTDPDPVLPTLVDRWEELFPEPEAPEIIPRETEPDSEAPVAEI